MFKRLRAKRGSNGTSSSPSNSLSSQSSSSQTATRLGSGNKASSTAPFPPPISQVDSKEHSASDEGSMARAHSANYNNHSATVDASTRSSEQHSQSNSVGNNSNGSPSTKGSHPSDSLKSNMSSKGSSNQHRKHQSPVRKSKVAFGTVQVRSYERALGDNPSCSAGAPISYVLSVSAISRYCLPSLSSNALSYFILLCSIGWNFIDNETRDCDEFERQRGERRTERELIVSRYHRQKMLMEWGESLPNIVEAIRANVKTKHQRRRTVNSIGTYDRFEEVMENAGRSLFRGLRGGSRSKNAGKGIQRSQFAASGQPSQRHCAVGTVISEHSSNDNSSDEHTNHMISLSQEAASVAGISVRKDTGNSEDAQAVSSDTSRPSNEESPQSTPGDSDDAFPTNRVHSIDESELTTSLHAPVHDIYVDEEQLTVVSSLGPFAADSIAVNEDGEGSYGDDDDVDPEEYLEAIDYELRQQYLLHYGEHVEPPGLEDLCRFTPCTDVMDSSDGPWIRRTHQPIVISEDVVPEIAPASYTHTPNGMPLPSMAIPWQPALDPISTATHHQHQQQQQRPGDRDNMMQFQPPPYSNTIVQQYR